MADDPHPLFETWFNEAAAAEPNDHNAMALATADAEGWPSVRMVLLKGHDPRGFVFFTNLDSRKGGELADNPRAALLFPWKSLRRQVRTERSEERRVWTGCVRTCRSRGSSEQYKKKIEIRN